MPAQTPPIATHAAEALTALGAHIRERRKALRVSAVAAAQAAGMSRVTLHRVENGEASVTIGAYANAMAALGLELGVLVPPDPHAVTRERDASGWIPVRVRLDDYPQLKRLAWQVQGIDELTPSEALGIYERNWRHIDQQALEPHERQLVEALRRGLGNATSRGV